MALLFQPVTLDASSPDRDGALVFRDERLLAVVTCLSDIHDDLAGSWFIEAAFGELPHPQPTAFATLETLRTWLAGTG